MADFKNTPSRKDRKKEMHAEVKDAPKYDKNGNDLQRWADIIMVGQRDKEQVNGGDNVADFKETKQRTVSRIGELKQQKKTGLSESRTELIMQQLREMYPEQYVNKYPINKRKDEWAPMISVLGENLNLFETQYKKVNVESDMSNYIPPTTEKILSVYLNEGRQKYYTIFGEGNTEILFPSQTSMIDVRWKSTYPDQHNEAFRLNLRDNGKATSVTLMPFESRLQRRKVKDAIDKVWKSRPVEYSFNQKSATDILDYLEKVKEKEVVLFFNAKTDSVEFLSGDKAPSIGVNVLEHGSRKRDTYAVYRTADIENAMKTYLASDNTSKAAISFDVDTLFTMRFRIAEPAPGYYQAPVREFEAMSREAQEKVRETNAEGNVMIFVASTDTSGRNESLPLGSLGNKGSKRPKR
jgi:hypothetical protein